MNLIKLIPRIIIGLIATVSVFNGSGQRKAVSNKPNIIFILADDLGYGEIGCYGQQKIETPNLDNLAKMGVRFTNFYSGSSVCAPARCSFMSGLHTGHTAIRGNVLIKPEGQFPLPDSVLTIAMLLQQNGYYTAAFGKWALGFITSTGDPQRKGFDEFYGYNCQTLAHNYYPDHLWHNHDRIDLPGNLTSDSVYSADLIHMQAMNFLRAEHSKPFFLYLPYTLPHADVIAPHDKIYNYYVNKFKEQAISTPKSADGEKHHYDTHPHAAYATMVSRLDQYVGEIMKMLKNKSIERNTLLIFSSDNGPHKENGGDPVFFKGSGGLKGIKRDLYEGGIREPFIAYKKGMTKAGSVNNMPSILYDLFPTFLELAGVINKSKIDGQSLVSSLMGLQQQQHPYLYWELHESGGKQAIRMGDWKAVWLDVSKKIDPPMELYNLKDDPGEKNNVAAKNPNVLKQMKVILKEAYVPNKDWPLLASEPGANAFK